MKREENVTCWVDCWNSSLNESDTTTDEMQAARWNTRADQFGKDLDDVRKQQKTADFFDLMDEAGFSPKGARVLDIGCGYGSLSIPLAQAGAAVTSLDISSGMLHRVKETAERERLNITPLECSWWSADIDHLGFRNAFDLVVASMTPAIRDVETFDRMMACSRKFCYYSNFLRKDSGKIPADIHTRVPGLTPKRPIFAGGFLYPFMYLYTRGFCPVIRFTHKSEHYTQDWAEAAAGAIDYFQFEGDLPDETREKIREYFKSIAVNGRYISTSEKYTGMMAWQVE